MATPAFRANGIQFGPRDLNTYGPACGAVADGVADDTAAINAALAACGAHCYLPSGVYKITGTLVIPQGVTLIGAGLQSTVISYTGTGDAILCDGLVGGGVTGVTILVYSAASTARAIHVANTTRDQKYCHFEKLLIVQAQTPTAPVAGQIGIYFDCTQPSAMYWNSVRDVRLGGWATGIKLLGSGPSVAGNGANQNHFSAVMVFASIIGLDISSLCSDNTVHGLFGSSSGFAGTALLQVGDTNGATSQSKANQIFGLVSDQGATPKGFQIQSGAYGTTVCYDNESAAGTDAGTNTTTIDTLNGIIKTQTMTAAAFTAPSGTVQSVGGPSMTGLNIGVGASAQILFLWNNNALVGFNSTPSLYPATNNNGSIGVLANKWGAGYFYRLVSGAQVIAAAASLTLGSASGGKIRLNLSATAITSLGITAGQDGEHLTVLVAQDATGSRTIPTTWTGVRFAGGTYTASTGANKIDCLKFIFDSTANAWIEEGARALAT